MLKDFFYGKELNKKLNPDEAVAYGATIEAAIQMGKYSEDVVLLDVCPFSLGIAVVNRTDDQIDQMLMSKVIERGSKLPCKKMEIFNPAEDYQKSLSTEMKTIHSVKEVLGSEINEVTVETLDSITHTPAVIIRKL